MEKLARSVKGYMRQELAKSIKSRQNLVVTNINKVSVTELQKLRGSLKKMSSDYMVVKNSIARLALKDCGLEDLSVWIDGSVGLTFSSADIVAISKALMDFKKAHEGFTIKGGMFDGKVVDFTGIEQISKLPSREALLAMIVTTMKSPITNFVFALKNTTSKLVYCINAIKAKKEGEVKNG